MEEKGMVCQKKTPMTNSPRIDIFRFYIKLLLRNFSMFT